MGFRIGLGYSSFKDRHVPITLARAIATSRDGLYKSDFHEQQREQADRTLNEAHHYTALSTPSNPLPSLVPPCYLRNTTTTRLPHLHVVLRAREPIARDIRPDGAQPDLIAAVEVVVGQETRLEAAQELRDV